MPCFTLNNTSPSGKISYALSTCFSNSRAYIRWDQMTRKKNNLSKLRRILNDEYYNSSYNEINRLLSQIAYRSLDGQTWTLGYNDVFKNY